MDDLDPRLDQLARLGEVPLAEPEPVDALRRRARRVRAGRTAKVVTALAVSVALVGAVVAYRSSGDSGPKHLRVAAPSFVLGDIDAVVLSSSFDADGARNPLPASLAAVVAHVPGVQRVSGVVDTFTPLVETFRLATNQPPRTTILFSYHQPDELHLTSGRLPGTADEVVVDAEFLARHQLAVGDRPSVELRGQATPLHIVGTFDLPDVDVGGVPLAAMAAQFQSSDLALDRIDVKLAPGADAANVRDAIATAVGNDYVVTPPSIISFPDQRLAQLEIQHAYWSLLSPDPNERETAGAGPANPQGNEQYEQHRSEAMNAELRVENVTFLSPTTATLTYRVYYSGSPSPIVTEPQPGAAVRVDGVWKISSATLCQLAAFENIPCAATGKVTLTPPAGWQDAHDLDGDARHVIEALADPAATVDQRTAVLMFGDQDRATVERGITSDQTFGESHLSILGWRSSTGGIDVLYVIVTSKGPSTPWPMIAHLVRGDGGEYVAGPQYACGIQGLATGGCSPATGSEGTPLTIDVAPASP